MQIQSSAVRLVTWDRQENGRTWETCRLVVASWRFQHAKNPASWLNHEKTQLNFNKICSFCMEHRICMCNNSSSNYEALSCWHSVLFWGFLCLLIHWSYTFFFVFLQLYVRSRVVQKFPAWHTKAAPNGKCCEGYIVPSVVRLVYQLKSVLKWRETMLKNSKVVLFLSP